MRFKLIILALIFILTACTNKSIDVQNDKLKIVVSFYPIYLFTQNVIEDVEDIEVYNLTLESTGCLHDYHLTTENMMTLEDADIFIINGLGMEPFLDKIKMSYPNLTITDTSEGVELIESKYEEAYNSHIWLSLSNAMIQVENIGNALSKIDTKNESKYSNNVTSYNNKLKELRNNAREALYGIEEINIVTMHDAFPYFAQDIGINITDVIQRNEDESPTPKELIDITKNIKENNVKGICIEPQYSDKVANLLSSETGVGIYILDSIVTGEIDKEEYINRMRQNIEIIKDLVKKTS